MKRILFTIFVMCAAGVVSQAQVTELPEGFTSGKTVWMVHIGAGFNSVSSDGIEAGANDWIRAVLSEPHEWYADNEYKRKFGMNFSVAFTRNFGKSPVYWGMELGIGKRGFKQKLSAGYIEMTTSSNIMQFKELATDQTSNLLAEYVQFIPVNIGYRYLINDKMALDVHAGVFTSYDYWGHYTTDALYYRFDDTNRDNNMLMTSQAYLDTQDMYGYHKFDTGIIGGIGFWYGHFHIECGYQYGFVSVFKGDDGYHCNSWQAKLGYAF